MTIWFVTPAWRRYELSAICFEQRRRAMDELASHGIEARCVVVADDENLDIARSLGFDRVERDNRWVGRKFNDGIEYALAEGADWVVPIGSDSWLDAAYLIGLQPGHARTSRRYTVIESDRMLILTIDGVGPHVLHRDHFVRSGPRPAGERLRRGFDTSLLRSLGPIDWEVRDLHPLQYVGFRGERHITLYAKLRSAWGGEERMDPWADLARHYPGDLVIRARQVMAHVRRPLSVGRFDRWAIRDRLLATLDRLRR